jgi:hypothetical protein
MALKAGVDFVNIVFFFIFWKNLHQVSGIRENKIFFAVL